MFGDAEHYKYLTNEADLNNVVDDSIALTPKTPKREETKLTALSPQVDIDITQQQQQQAAAEAAALAAEQAAAAAKQQQEVALAAQQQHQLLEPSNKHLPGSVGNMSMTESIDASFFNSVKNVHTLEADNIPVEARPKAAG
jgi:hypothetical protein